MKLTLGLASANFGSLTFTSEAAQHCSQGTTRYVVAESILRHAGVEALEMKWQVPKTRAQQNLPKFADSCQ